MVFHKSLSCISVSIGLSIALLSCSQPSQHPKKDKKPAPVAKETAVAAPKKDTVSQPHGFANNVPPPPPPPIEFIPPAVYDEPVPPAMDLKEFDSKSTTMYDGFDVEPPPAMMVPKDNDQNEPLQYVEEPAEFPGGGAALKKYLTDHLRYPEAAKELAIEGKCYVRFVVSATGDISNVQVVKGISDCKECDAEAVRLVKGMPKWKPGKQGGKAVSSYFHLPVAFKLQ